MEASSCIALAAFVLANWPAYRSNQISQTGNDIAQNANRIASTAEEESRRNNTLIARSLAITDATNRPKLIVRIQKLQFDSTQAAIDFSIENVGPTTAQVKNCKIRVFEKNGVEWTVSTLEDRLVYPGRSIADRVWIDRSKLSDGTQFDFVPYTQSCGYIKFQTSYSIYEVPGTSFADAVLVGLVPWKDRRIIGIQ